MVCVVTGGGTGIGLMATQALAANGAKVYITGRRPDVLSAAAESHHPSNGGQIIPTAPCDVTKKEDLEHLVQEIEAKEECIHLLVNNAGTSGPKAEPDETDARKLKEKLWGSESVEAWADVYTTNVTAVYFTTLAFLPLLQRATHSSSPNADASVLIISSMSGLMTSSQGHFSYNAAKGATVHLTKLLSGELTKLHIRVNSIAPGYFPSEMTVKESDERNKSELPDEKVREKGHVPAGRPGREEEMGMAVLFLGRCGYVNGEVVVVDGGALLEVSAR